MSNFESTCHTSNKLYLRHIVLCICVYKLIYKYMCKNGYVPTYEFLRVNVDVKQHQKENH